jgi:prophage maintenance system killer protein/prophage antirepressor-like protein
MKNKALKNNNLIIYQTKSGAIELRGDLKHETLWATQAQIVNLFDINQSVVSRHIRNVLKDGEVNEKSNMQKMHIANSDKPIVLYSLDLILAVGYRANSSKAIEFRKWSSMTLKKYLIKGYVVNEKRLKESTQNSLKELQKTLGFIQGTIRSRQLDSSEVDSLLSVIKDYTNSFILLNKYDEGDVTVAKNNLKSTQQFSYEFVRPAVDILKGQLIKSGDATDLFSNERDGSFSGILKTIYQTFDKKELYGSLEEKAAHLLYFIIKDHPFSDGNKRVGAFLFVLFLDKNKILYRKTGEKKINDSALVALALLVAQSDPKEKEQMVALITQLIK